MDEWPNWWEMMRAAIDEGDEDAVKDAMRALEWATWDLPAIPDDEIARLEEFLQDDRFLAMEWSGGLLNDLGLSATEQITDEQVTRLVSAYESAYRRMTSKMARFYVTELIPEICRDRRVLEMWRRLSKMEDESGRVLIPHALHDLARVADADVAAEARDLLFGMLDDPSDDVRSDAEYWTASFREREREKTERSDSGGVDAPHVGEGRTSIDEV